MLDDVFSVEDGIWEGEAEKIKQRQRRERFADYGLHPEKHPKIAEVLKQEDERKKNPPTINCGPCTCVVCSLQYHGNSNLCFFCSKIYTEEDLYWRQGKILEE